MLLTAASLALRGSGLCFQVYVTNRIGAAGVGLLQLVASVGLLATTLGTAGVRVAAMYLAAEEYGARRPGGMRKALLCCLVYGLAASVLGGLCLARASGWLAERWIGDPRAALSLRVLGFSMPVSCLWSVLAGYLTACSRLKELVAVEFIDQALSIAVTAALLSLWAGVDIERACAAIHLGSAAAAVFTLALLLRAALRERNGPVPKGLSMWKRLFRLCIPLAANDALRSGLSTAEQLIIPRGLARYGGSREEAMAGYGAIHGMVFPILMFPAVLLTSLSDLLVPELARCRAAKDARRIRALAGRGIRMTLLFAAAWSGLAWSLAGPLGQLLYHSGEAGRYLRMFAPLVLVLYLDATVDGMHKGLGQQVYCVRVNTLTNLLDVVFLWLTLPRWGVAGYFFTFTFTHVLNFFLSLARLMTVSGCVPPLGPLLKTLGSAAAAALATGLLPLDELAPLSACLLGGTGFLAVFALFLLLSGAAAKEDRKWFRSLLGIPC